MMTNKFLLPAILAIKFIITISNDFEINGQNQSIVKRIILHELQSFLEEKFEALILDFSIKKNIFLKLEESIEKEKILETLEIKKILITIYEKALTENGIKNSDLEKIGGEILKNEESDESKELIKRIRKKIGKLMSVDKKISDAQAEINKAKEEGKSLEDNIKLRNEPTEDLKNNKKDLETTKTRIKKLCDELNKSDLPKLKKLDTQKTIMKNGLDQINSKRSALEDRVQKTSDEIEKRNSKIEQNQSELDKIKKDAKEISTETHNLVLDFITQLTDRFEAKQTSESHRKKSIAAVHERTSVEMEIELLKMDIDGYKDQLESELSQKKPEEKNIETEIEKNLKYHIKNAENKIISKNLTISEIQKKEEDENKKKEDFEKVEGKSFNESIFIENTLTKQNYHEEKEKIKDIFRYYKHNNIKLEEERDDQKKAEEALIKVNEEAKELEEKLINIEKNINDLNDNKKEEISEAKEKKSELEKLKIKQSDLRKKIEDEEKKIQTEIENLKKELNTLQDSIKNAEDKITSAKNELKEIEKNNSPIKIKETKKAISPVDKKINSIRVINSASCDSEKQIPTIPVKPKNPASEKDINLKPRETEVNQINDGQPDNKQSVRLDKGRNRVENNKDSNKKDDKDGPNVWIWVIGCLGVLVIGAILFFFKEKEIKRRRH